MEVVLVKDLKGVEASLKLRHDAFIIGQNVPREIEVDEYDVPDSEVDHFLMMEGNEPIGTFRLKYLEDNQCKIQRFCLREDLRFKGYGRQALAFIDEFCKNKGISKIVLDGQYHAVEFYLKGGYKIVSDKFVEAGIEHVLMEKEI